MSPLRTSLRLIVLLILSSWCVWSYQPTLAQDRGAPRFGGLVSADTVKAGAFDFGRQWSFADPPSDYLNETYGVPADARGFNHMVQNAVRLPECSGALVSPRGLVLTAAGCVRPRLSSASPGSLRTEALVARSEAEEYRLSDFYVDRTVDVRDVTDRVNSVLTSRQDISGADEAVAAVEEELDNTLQSDERIDVVREGGGSRYAAYTYQRYDDIRLVMLPERSVTVSGNPVQELAYPQHTWDGAILRIYEDQEPLRTPDHLEIRPQGGRPGDVVFAIGHPDELNRSEPLALHEFRRDVTLPTRLELLETWTSNSEEYVEDVPSSSVSWEHQVRETRRAVKVLRARLEALRNEYFMARLDARDDQFRIRAGRDSNVTATVDRLFDQLERLQQRKRALADRYRAFAFLLHPEYASPTLRRAFLVYHNLQGVSDAPVDDLAAVPELPDGLDAALLDSHLETLRSVLSADSGLVETLDGLPSPASVVRSSVFSDEESARTALNSSALPPEDPAVTIVSAFFDQYRAFKEEWLSLQSREGELVDSLARERHNVEDLPITLAQDQSPRLADGRIQGYPYNGTLAPPFTTFYGLLGVYHSGLSDTESLPPRWQSNAEALDLDTPLNTVSSTDMGGSRGGPLLDSSLQVVGIQVDQNIQSPAGQYLFLPQRMRTVALDIRSLVEGLTTIYDAEGLVQEMKGAQASVE